MLELKPQYLQLVKSKFFYLCSFILSHPLYFSYFIFFSPYILKLLSFLSPLFITTTLLLLALFTISPSLILHNNTTKGLMRKDDELNALEEFEAYKIVFGASKIDDQVNSVEFLDYASAEESESPLGENSGEMESTKHVIEEKTWETFKELDEFENNNLSHNVEVKKVDKIIEKQEDEALVRLNNVHSQGLSKNLENVGIGYGSMRKEKEWKRTLACKLFEERHNDSHSNSEGMDMLWEKYEMDTTKNKAKKDLKKMKKKGELKGYEKERDEDEQEMDDDQQLCCLQALKFSAGKMNLGMGRPNLVKISKAFKGFGWLHHVGKNNKKVHCGDGF
ncbi:unnamed protein product [Withania somnifera]